MRTMILGTVAGLLIGSIGALAYSHFIGDGGQLAALQAELAAAKSKLADSEAKQRFLREQNNSTAQQVDQLVASNEQLKKEVATGQTDPAAAATPASTPSILDPNLIRGIMGMMRGGPGGGFRSPEQRLFVMQNRLKLDPEQAKALKAAMDADNKARREAFRQARQNHTPPDPQALAAANTLDKTLQSVLTPQQQAAYQQLQSDEKAAQAETSATAQVDNLMPLLQLTDAQKQQAMTALYQQQLSVPDPASLMGNPNAIQVMTQQGQAMQTAMKQVLNPDQFALYQQSEQMQQQAFAAFAGGGGRRGGNGPGGPNGGGPNDNAGGGNAPAVATASGVPSTPTPTTAAPTDTTSAPTGTITSATTGTDTTTASTSTTTSTGSTSPAAASN